MLEEVTWEDGALSPLLDVAVVAAACRFAAVGMTPAVERFLIGIGGSAVVGGPAAGFDGRGSVAAIADLTIVSENKRIYLINPNLSAAFAFAP